MLAVSSAQKQRAPRWRSPAARTVLSFSMCMKDSAPFRRLGGVGEGEPQVREVGGDEAATRRRSTETVGRQQVSLPRSYPEEGPGIARWRPELVDPLWRENLNCLGP